MTGTASKNLITEIKETAQQELCDGIGMRKHTGEIYTRQVSEDIIGTVGLNSAVHRGDGRMSINPMVGVRHQLLEKYVSELMEIKPHPYTPSTVARNIGYMMPEQTYLQWLFEEGMDNASEFKRMVQAVEVYGFPFMEANSTLNALIETMEQLKLPYVYYQLPVAYRLVGEEEQAKEVLQRQLEALGDREDAGAQNYKKFASNFSKAH